MSEKTPYEKALGHLAEAAQKSVQDGATPAEVTAALLTAAASSAIAQDVESTDFQDLAARFYTSVRGR